MLLKIVQLKSNYVSLANDISPNNIFLIELLDCTVLAHELLSGTVTDLSISVDLNLYVKADSTDAIVLAALHSQ